MDGWHSLAAVVYELGVVRCGVHGEDAKRGAVNHNLVPRTAPTSMAATGARVHQQRTRVLDLMCKKMVCFGSCHLYGSCRSSIRSVDGTGGRGSR